MVKDLLVLSKDNVKVKGYFQENRDLFAGVINSIVKTTPGLEDYDLAGDLYKIVPDLLDHPDQLISIINLYEKGKYSEVGQEFLGLIQEDPKIKQYFTDNGELFKRILIDKTMGMKSYGVKDEVADIFKHIMKEQNISKIQGLLDQYEKGNWLGLVTDTCRMIEEDHKFAQYMRDNKESFNKIVTAIVDSYPMIKTYTGNVSVGTLAANLLQDPKQIREVVEGYQAGGVQMVKQGEKFLAAKAMDSDVRGVVLQVATGWIFADGSGKQEVINRIPETLIETRVVQENNVTLNDAARAVITAGDNSAKKQELNTLLDRNILFDGVTIGSTRKHVKLEHLDINNSFVNSQFNNVSFQGSKFTNASFTGATFTNTDFSKAEIDGATLNSLIPALKNGTISLNGSKIIGDMPASLDLSDISLQGVDLSAVTSMNDVNLRNTDLQGAILPTDQTILKTSYNLMSAKFDSEMSVLKEQNQNYMLDLIVDSIASRAEYLGGELLDPVLLRQNIEKLYIGDTPMGKELREAISQNPDSIKYKNFPVAVDSYKNTKDLLTTSAVMTLLYENRNDSGNIQVKLAANSVADQVTKKIFGQGSKRGQDGYMIREACQLATQNFLKENPDVTAHDFIGSENLLKLIDELAIDIKKKTKYTTVGLASGGVYLPEGVMTGEFITTMTRQMNNACLFNKAELEQIHEISKAIGQNLFQAGEEGRRKEDSKLIFENLKDIISEIKKEYGGVEVANILKEKKEELVGKVEKGTFSTARSALTEQYYQGTSYTTLGLASGGVYLDSTKVKNSNFIPMVKEFIKGLIGKNLSKQTKLLQVASTSNNLKNMVSEAVSQDIKEHVSGTETNILPAKLRATGKPRISIK